MTPIGRLLRSPSDPDRAYVQIDEPYVAGAQGLDRFSHIILLYMLPGPTFDPALHLPGVFATRDEVRPNPLGFSVVELIRVEDELLTVRGVNAIAGTPVLDIKPYVSDLDAVPNAVKG